MSKPPRGDDFAGTAVLGERGQVVIPKTARQKLKLKTGDSFVVMVHNDAIVFLPKKRMASIIKQLTEHLPV
jgi:AbrB family looped-hinge helix DNA binding protein